MACRVTVKTFAEGPIVYLSWKGGSYALIVHLDILTQSAFERFIEELNRNNKAELRLTRRTAIEFTPDYMLYIADVAYPRYERVLPVCIELLDVLGDLAS